MARVFILDDEMALCEMVAEMLRSAGYQTKCSNKANEALKQIVAYDPDIVIVDINLNCAINGLRVAEQLRNNHLCQDIPIIIMTGNINPELQIEGYKLGINEFLVKPFDMKILTAICHGITKHNIYRRLQHYQGLLNESTAFGLPPITDPIWCDSDVSIEKLSKTTPPIPTKK